LTFLTVDNEEQCSVRHSYKVKHGKVDNDMTSDKIPSEDYDEYFEQLLDEEEYRSQKKMNQHARLTIIRNAKLQAEIVNNKIIKQFPNMPGQWLLLHTIFDCQPYLHTYRQQINIGWKERVCLLLRQRI
jgi:hypothetical protein